MSSFSTAPPFANFPAAVLAKGRFVWKQVQFPPDDPDIPERRLLLLSEDGSHGYDGFGREITTFVCTLGDDNILRRTDGRITLRFEKE